MTQPPEGTLFHLTTRDEWDQALQAGAYTRSTRGLALDEVGFIHCSLPTQLAGVAARFYADCQEPLVVLQMSQAALERGGIPVRFEDAGTGELFPHLYAPLPCGLVEAVIPASIDSRGALTLED